MAGTSLVHIKLPSTPPLPDEAASAAYVETEIAKKNTTPGAGLALNVDGIAYDVVAADGTIVVDVDDIAVGIIGTANIADGAVGNLQSSVTLGGLNNVDITVDTGATQDDVLLYDGTEWVAGSLGAGATPGAGLALNATVTTDFDVVAADGTIVVTADAIAVGVIGTANIADGAVGNLQSSVTLGGLNNVDITADSPAAAGNILSWSGTEWAAVAPAAGVTAGAGLTDTAGTFAVVAGDTSLAVTADAITVGPKGITTAHLADGAVTNLQSAVTLGGLNNVDISADTPTTSGDVLTWDGTEWAASAIPATVYTAGAGLVETTAGTFDIGAGSGITVAVDSIAADAAIVQFRSEKGVANGYAPLDAANLIPSIHLPSLNVSDITVVLDDAARLAQTGLGVGDVTVQTADSTAWIVVDATDLSLPASWSQITNTGTVTTVNSIPGPAVVLTATDVGAAADTTTVTAGAGLTGGGDLTAPRTIDVAAGAGIAVAADAVSVDRLVTDTWYSALAHAHALDDLSDVDTVTLVPAAGNHLVFNGTAWAPAAAGVAVQKFAAAVGDGAALTYTVTHNLNTTDVTVQAWQGVDAVNVGVATAGVNAVTVTFAVAPAAGAVRVVVIG